MRPLSTLVSTTLLITMATATAAQASPGAIHRGNQPIPDEYIVVFKDVPGKAVRASADALARQHGGEVKHNYEHALRGFSVHLSEKAALALSHNPNVLLVEENEEVQASSVQISPANWALDRIDQRNPPLDGLYSYGTTGQGVNAYIVDSGIHPTHTEFTGRVFLDRDYVQDAGFGVDCFGHGTAVAGILGGTNHGVAKQVNLHILKVFDCAGDSELADIVAALDWVTWVHVKPAVLNLSINRPCGPHLARPCLEGSLDLAAKGLIQQGVILVNSAGNGSACDSNSFVSNSPALFANPIVVGATVLGFTDSRVNGTCAGGEVDIYAPGWELTTASHIFPTGTVLFSYTSAAAPVVAGAVARYLQTHPTANHASVEYHLQITGTPHIVGNVPFYGGSQLNPFLYVQP